MSRNTAVKDAERKIAFKTLKHYLPSLLIMYDQCVSRLSRDDETPNENLTALFKMMWKMNLLFKHFLEDEAVTPNELSSHRHSEASNDKKNWDDLERNLKEVHKTIWTLNFLLAHKFNFDD